MATPTGGIITTDGLYTVHTFLRADTGTNMTFPNAGNVRVLVVPGGGSGGSGGGGGGQVIEEASHAVIAQDYLITVGAGGTPSYDEYEQGKNGGNSIFDTITGYGGGGGGSMETAGSDGGNGGGAGEASGADRLGGNPTHGDLGYKGGDTKIHTANYPGAGGGGSGGAGQDAQPSSVGGNGGAGLSSTIYDGSTKWYGAGGGGGVWGSGTAGSGGSGVGGNGCTDGGTAQAGAANTGSGGGGGAKLDMSGAGADGIVIIRYLTSDFSGAPPLVGPFPTHLRIV